MAAPHYIVWQRRPMCLSKAIALGLCGGWGQTGPLAGAPVHDIGAPGGDLAGSMFSVVAVLGALLQRNQSGKDSILMDYRCAGELDDATHWGSSGA